MNPNDHGSHDIEYPEDRILSISREFDAPRERVFEAWTTREHIVSWWGPEGYQLSYCEMDFEVGGHWEYCMRNVEDGTEHWIRGEYLEIDEPARLVFTYINNDDANVSVVTLDFVELDGARTELRFRQIALPSVAERDGHEGGWSSSFNLLEDYVNSGSRPSGDALEAASSPPSSPTRSSR